MTTMAPEELSAATRAVLHRYEHELYNARNLDVIAELLADPMLRLDAGGKVSEMSHADCRARIGGFFAQYQELVFRTVHQIVDGTLASWTYQLNGVSNDGSTLEMSSIEIFEVIDDKITRVWNAAYTDGPWPE